MHAKTPSACTPATLNHNSISHDSSLTPMLNTILNFRNIALTILGFDLCQACYPDLLVFI